MATLNFDFNPVLGNARIGIRPLVPGDFQDLFACASDPLIWEQHPEKLRYERAAFQVYFDEAIKSGSAFLISDVKTGSAIGSSRYYDYSAEENSVAVGYTFLTRAYWGNGYNLALKQLMLDHAFRFVDIVILHIGENNMRSRKATEKLGALKIAELERSFSGRANVLNFIYQLNKKDWIRKSSHLFTQKQTMERPLPDEYMPHFQHYLDQSGEGEFFNLLEQNTAEVFRFFNAIPPDKENYAYAPGKWTIKSVLMHLIDVDRIFSFRALVAARLDPSPLPSFEEDEYAAHVDVTNRSMENLLTEFEAVRKTIILQFENATEAQSRFKGNVSGHPISPRAIGFIIIGHANHHLSILTERYF